MEKLMLQVLIDHPWVGWLLLSILSISGTIIGFLIRSKVLDNDKKISENAEEIDEIKKNYLDRFDEVNDRIMALRGDVHSHHLTVMLEMGKVLKAVDHQAEFCRIVQEQKKLK